MKLCIGITEDMFRKQAVFKNYTDSGSTFDLEQCVIYSGEAVLNAGILYLARAEALPETISARKGAAMICIGMPQAVYTSLPLRLLVLE